MRSIGFILCGLAGAAGCEDAPPAPPPGCGGGAPVEVSGRAFVFGPGGGSLEGAVVSVAEAPDVSTTVAADGRFRLLVPSGGECSFLLRQPGFHDSQTAVLPIGAEGLAQVGFQVPTERTFQLLAALVAVEPDPTRCQIATTVSAAGTAPYGGSGLGVPDATGVLTPPPPPDGGPFYFRYVDESLIVPDTRLTATTIDGGLFYTNVPPGEYRLEARHATRRFTSVKVRCRAGLLVNAAPPWGLQEL